MNGLIRPMQKLKTITHSFALCIFASFLTAKDAGNANGLAPEVVDLTAEDVSFQLEKELPYLDQPFITTQPQDLEDGLVVGSLDLKGSKKDRVLAYAKKLGQPASKPKAGKIDSLLIAHRGKLVLEAYYRRGRVNYPHYQMSITKSYTAYAVGRAIQLGHLTMKDLHKPVVSYLKDLDVSKLAKGADKITLHQAMQMRSGIRLSKGRLHNVVRQPSLLVGQKQAQAYLQHSQPIQPAPRGFKYQSSDPVLTMQVLETVVPGTAEQFIREQLLRPMQITNYHWQEDLSGFPKSAAGSSFLSRDMMKMGLLTLNGGKWDGKQHLPKEFVKTATSPLVRTRPTNHYGYFWWSQNHEINGVQYPSAQGRGAGGQFIFVFPTIDLVVTATAHNQGMGTILWELPELLISAFTS